MNTADTFSFLPTSGTSRMDLMDQAGAANDRMYVMGRYPDLTRLTDSAASIAHASFSCKSSRRVQAIRGSNTLAVDSAGQ